MPTWVRKVVKGTLIAKGVGVLLIALAIGGSQVLLRQLPAHQLEIKEWVSTELGFDLEFARLDASWSWRGPELAFRDVSIKTVGDPTPFITARGASVGFNPFNLIGDVVRGGKIGVDRLTFEGTELTLVKTETGAYRLQGAPASSREALWFQVPPDIDVLVRDSRVLYLEAGRNIAWSFQDVAGSMRRNGTALTLDASARPPRELAARIGVSLRASIAQGAKTPGAQYTGDWRLSADVDEVDLAAAAQLLPAPAPAPKAGSGDVQLQLEWQSGSLVGGVVDVALTGVELSGGPVDAAPRYERIGLAGNWQRRAGGWHVALSDVAVARAESAWPGGATADIDVAEDAGGIDRVALRSSFVRLEDLTPFLAPLPPSSLLDKWLRLAPRGDLRDVDVALTRATGERLDYTVTGQFAGLGVAPLEGLPGVAGLTGEVRADSLSGRLELRSSGAALDWPAVFRSRLDVPELRGIVVWRSGQDAVRLVSDDLLVVTPDATLRSNLELTLPMDGSSPQLDVRTGVSGFDLAVVPRYLPAKKMPPTVVDWLDGALRGGRALSADVVFVGPVRSFPFDGGEGEFRATAVVEHGALAFINDWPAAEDLDGTVNFVNASFAARGSGRVLGNRTADLRVGMADLRTGELALQANTIGPLDQLLAFLNSAPLIMRYLGEDFSRLESPSGTGEVSIDLLLPLRDRESYQLTAGLNVIDGELAYRGFGPHATEIQGSVTLADGVLRGSGIQGIFLDGPVTADVDAAGLPGYRTRISFDGEVTIDEVVAAFDLPYGELAAGQTRWQGQLLIPAIESDARLPARIIVDSNLTGVALRFPEPFAKAPSVPSNLEVDMSFPDAGFEMRGYLGATRRFALQFDADPDNGRFRFRRAALRFGGALPEFRADRGVTLDGSLPLLRVDDWLPISHAGAAGRSQWSGTFAGADLDVAEFSLFGQQLGSTRITARRRTDDWQFELDSNAIAGTLFVPLDLARDPQVVAVMRRLYLNAGDSGGSESVDPRDLPGVQLHADEFGVGQHQLGRLDAEILSDPLGLRLVSFESATDSFSAQGTGGWFVGADGNTTRLAVSVNSTDVGKMLDQLGFAPFVEAQTAEVTASVYWPGPPSGAWLDHINGDLALRAAKGSLIDVEPGGAGRMVGLLSISALPRRLALDFRDVFNRGFVFDEITADFLMLDGNAYTDNLKLTGPVAEVGIIGRTGLRDHDYRQQAIVTAEPGKMLPTVGALIGGPAVAAALLIFTRIFKKPLGGIGRASYCVTGSWQEPTVERLTTEQLDKGALCAELPPNGALSRPAEVAAR